MIAGLGAVGGILTTRAGKRDQLAGILQQRYGYEKAQAEKELDDFTRSLKP